MKPTSSLFIKLLLIPLFMFASLSIHPAEQSVLTKTLVDSNGHKMTLWHKQPKTDFDQTKQIILLHGRTWSSLPDFDLQVEGESLSVMDNLVKLGFSVWALDARGYGETPRDESGWNNPNKAATDAANVIKWIAAETKAKPIVFGWSYGSMVAQLMVQQNQGLVKGVILYGYPIDPEEVIEAVKMPSVAPKNKNTAKNAASDFIVPGTISQNAINTYIAESLKADPYRADWNKLQQWNQLDATKVQDPVLLLQAEHDPLADTDSHARFFVRLPNANKQWVVLAGGDHAALLETAKDRLVQSVTDFANWLDK